MNGVLKKYPLFMIFALALVLRLSFSFYFQQFYFGQFTYTTADTYTTYLNPFLNWLQHGVYMGDLYLEDSKYYAVPVYPFLAGAMYTIFGADSFLYIMAFLQSVIDSFTVLLVYLVVLKITAQNSMALVSSLLYATYPFVIVWAPISVTETLYLFIAWLVIYLSTGMIRSSKKAFILGALIGIGVLTKQHLGLLLILPVVMIALEGGLVNDFMKKAVLVLLIVLGFITVLSPWVARNYLQSGNLIVLKGETVGIRTFGKDFRAFEKFARNFDQNITPLVDEVSRKGTLTLKKHNSFVLMYQEEISDAARLAHVCGPSFMERRVPTSLDEPPHDTGCSADVIEAFNKLTKAFWDEVPLSQAIETRIDAVKKIYIKSNITNQKIQFAGVDIGQKAIFSYRTILLTLGVLGLGILLFFTLNGQGRNFAAASFIFSLVLYSYIAIIMVHVEMRYLLMADTLISMLASVPLVIFVKKYILKEQIS